MRLPYFARIQQKNVRSVNLRFYSASRTHYKHTGKNLSQVMTDGQLFLLRFPKNITAVQVYKYTSDTHGTIFAASLPYNCGASLLLWTNHVKIAFCFCAVSGNDPDKSKI